MYIKEYSLTDLANTNEVYLDTSAILSFGFEQLMVKNARYLKDNGQTVTIHRAVINELTKLLENGIPEESSAAQDRLNAIKALEEGGIIQYVGNQLDPHSAAQQYLELIVLHRNKKAIAVITNNNDLAHDVFIQNSILSFKGKKASAFSVSDNGDLTQIKTTPTYEDCTTDNKSTAITEDQTAKLLKMFGLH